MIFRKVFIWLCLIWGQWGFDLRATQRLGWSYYLNWAVILLKYVVAVLPNIYDRAQQPGVMVYSVGLKMVLFALLLLLPNYFYWTKRKHLFVN